MLCPRHRLGQRDAHRAGASSGEVAVIARHGPYLTPHSHIQSFAVGAVLSGLKLDLLSLLSRSTRKNPSHGGSRNASFSNVGRQLSPPLPRGALVRPSAAHCVMLCRPFIAVLQYILYCSTDSFSVARRGPAVGTVLGVYTYVFPFRCRGDLLRDTLGRGPDQG